MPLMSHKNLIVLWLEVCAVFASLFTWSFINGLLQFLVLIVALITGLIGLDRKSVV